MSETDTVVKKPRKPNPWLLFLKDYRLQNKDMTPKEIMHYGKIEYNKLKEQHGSGFFKDAANKVAHVATDKNTKKFAKQIVADPQQLKQIAKKIINKNQTPDTQAFDGSMDGSGLFNKMKKAASSASNNPALQNLAKQAVKQASENQQVQDYIAKNDKYGLVDKGQAGYNLYNQLQPQQGSGFNTLKKLAKSQHANIASKMASQAARQALNNKSVQGYIANNDKYGLVDKGQAIYDQYQQMQPQTGGKFNATKAVRKFKNTFKRTRDVADMASPYIQDPRFQSALAASHSMDQYEGGRVYQTLGGSFVLNGRGVSKGDPHISDASRIGDSYVIEQPLNVQALTYSQSRFTRSNNHGFR